MSRSLQAAVIRRAADAPRRLCRRLAASRCSSHWVKRRSRRRQTTVVLGNTATMPDPSCPESPCQAIGSVTGFQVSTSQGSLPFRVRKDGRIKSWTLTLSQPTSSQRSFFNGFFGTPPEARLAILRRVAGTNPPRYALRAQGSVHVLSPYLGQTVKFGASLRVKTGDISRPHRPHLGPSLRPRPALATTPGAPAANSANASTQPTSARANPKTR